MTFSCFTLFLEWSCMIGYVALLGKVKNLHGWRTARRIGFEYLSSDIIFLTLTEAEMGGCSFHFQLFSCRILAILRCMFVCTSILVSFLRWSAFTGAVSTLRMFLGRVQVAVKFVYIGIGAAVASYLGEFCFVISLTSAPELIVGASPDRNLCKRLSYQFLVSYLSPTIVLGT